MKTVEELREMLNEVKGTIEDVKDFEATTEKIIEAKLIFKIEKIQELFNKYQELFQELYKLPTTRNILSTFEWYCFSNSSYELKLMLNKNSKLFVPTIKLSDCSCFIKFEVNEKFNEDLSFDDLSFPYSTEAKHSTSIHKQTAKKLLINLDLEKLERKIINRITYCLGEIETDCKKQKEKIVENLEDLKDIPFMNLNNITDLPKSYIYLIKECLEGIKKFRLASIIGYDEFTESDFYKQIDEVLNNFINPLDKNDEDVKIIREEV